MPNLLWLFITPFIIALLTFNLFFLSGKVLKRVAFCFSLVPLLLILSGLTDWIGSEIRYAWLPFISVDFYLKVDALSFLFLCLISVVVPISLLATREKDIPHPHVFYGLIFILQGLLIGFFTARDLALFTFFWEAMLIPLYFMMSLWGGERKQQAALKFIVYMVAGAALMVAAVLALYLASEPLDLGKTFDLDQLALVSQNAPYAKIIFAIFLLAFAVKTPLFPFHGWLPDTYYYASSTSTILLSSILSKAGIYGILRIGMELFPQFMQEWGPYLVGFAVFGVLYGALAAWSQKDYKRLIAYSSFSHVNFILAGLFVWNATAHSGAIFQALNHGITIAALFLVAAWLEQRIGTTAIGPFKGLAKYLPKLCWFTMFFVAASVALPGTNNFVGELMILLGVFLANKWTAVILALSIILSAIYMLKWMQKVYFQEPSPFHVMWVDLNFKDILVASTLCAIILWMGIYPEPFLRQTQSIAKKIESINGRATS